VTISFLAVSATTGKRDDEAAGDPCSIKLATRPFFFDSSTKSRIKAKAAALFQTLPATGRAQDDPHYYDFTMGSARPGDARRRHRGTSMV
jgi:hypothetical protein